ncbi:MAG: DUF421 domain-containing protein [Spirochaetota bacterium]
MEPLLFDSWQSILRASIVTILAYLCIVFLLRVTGKRTLSKMNAFDLIVTIGLGSSFATVALNKSIPLADGVAVFFWLIFLQLVVSWLSVRVGIVKRIVTSKPTLLLFRGEVFEDELKRQRITMNELRLAGRQKGVADLQKLDAVVLETTGEITVIPEFEPEGKAETMADVGGYKSRADGND